MLGKHGDLLWRYANGIDEEAVRLYGDRPEIKSVSRGRTFKRDLVTEGEIKTAISVLADEVARALRKSNMKGEVVSVQIRRPDMVDLSRQTCLGHYTFLQLEIQEVAMALIRENWRIGAPIRALTVGVSKLIPKDQVVEQMSLFDFALQSPAGHEKLGSAARERQERLERLVDELREKHGEGSITLGYHENEDIGLKR
jgi:DNA polymerase-4